jgi:glycosyltransferase involved in cell wall biosynthesis
MARLIRRFRPDVVQTWMYHADLLGGLTARLVSHAPLLWNIRHSHLDPEKSKRTTIWVMRLCARLSASLPHRIVCNSHASLEVHANQGYAREKLLVIPNGFDLTVFRPDPAARAEVRREYAIPDAAPLIGLIGRFDAQKDQEGFLKAAGLFLRRCPNAHFLLCGRDVTGQNPQLAAWIEQNGLTGRCRLLGDRRDIPRLAAALDLAVSSSITESFPQVLGEAMACGVPCVATDVGDSARIIGDTGRIVPPRNPQAMAEAWEAMFSLSPEERAQRQQAARERIRTHYSLERIIEQYASLYREAVKR